MRVEGAPTTPALVLVPVVTVSLFVERMWHTPDSQGICFPVKFLHPYQVVHSSLGSGWDFTGDADGGVSRVHRELVRLEVDSCDRDRSGGADGDNPWCAFWV